MLNPPLFDGVANVRITFLSPGLAASFETALGAAPGAATITLDAPLPEPAIGVNLISYVVPLVRP
ncbi:MAG: hypothetical protein WCL21_20265, partial [Mariniphaga sp.]